MAEKIERKYIGSDDSMLERAEVFHDRLSIELVDFTARFPWLDAAWLTAFQNDIDAADAFPKDDSVILDIKVLTGDVTGAMRQGYAGLQSLGGYAKLAWPTDVARQRVFGQQHWTKAYNNTLKLQEALELAHEKADSASYKPELLAKGYTQAEIDLLATLSDEIKLKNRLQEAAKAGRAVSAHDRIAMLNVVWEHMLTINTCAKVVWAADAERQDQYKLYASSGSSGNDDDTPTTEVNISGTVTDTATTFPLENVEVSLFETASGPGAEDPTAFTDAQGNYSFNLPEVPGTYQATLLAQLTGYADASIALEIESGTDYTDQDIGMNTAP